MDCDGPRAWVTMERGPLTVAGNFGERETEVPVEGRLEMVLATAPGARLRDGLLSLPALAGAVVR